MWAMIFVLVGVVIKVLMNFPLLHEALTSQFHHLLKDHSIPERSDPGPSTRLIGGVPAKPPEGRYQVSLREYGTHICGGAIISPKYVVTAGHCIIDKNPYHLSVLSGTKNRYYGGSMHPVSYTYLHEFFEPNPPKYDIGIIEIGGIFVFDHTIVPVNLPSKPVEDNEDVVVTGWGVTDTDHNYQPINLQIIHVITRTSKECQKTFPMIDDTQICTFTGAGEGTCMGDSGGPLVRGNELVGVVSFGIPCAKGAPDVFTNIFFFKDWIVDLMIARQGVLIIRD